VEEGGSRKKADRITTRVGVFGDTRNPPPKPLQFKEGRRKGWGRGKKGQRPSSESPVTFPLQVQTGTCAEGKGSLRGLEKKNGHVRKDSYSKATKRQPALRQAQKNPIRNGGGGRFLARGTPKKEGVILADAPQQRGRTKRTEMRGKQNEGREEVRWIGGRK